MGFIDNTYFIRDINLTSGQLTNITGWIDVYEKDLLIDLLGYPLYYELISDLVDGVPQTEKFTKLLTGDSFSFEYYGMTINNYWPGLIDSTKKLSLIAYYVYYQFKNETEYFNTSVGQKKTKSENADPANVIPKLTNAWNRMIDMYGVTPKDYNDNYFLNQDNYEHYNTLPSAYNYLLAKKEDFENWVFKPYRKINVLGI